MTDTKRTDDIRDRAHRLWEQDGRPDGKDADHWARAEAELEAEEANRNAADRDVPPGEAGGDTLSSSIAGTDAAAKPARAPRKRAAK